MAKKGDSDKLPDFDTAEFVYKPLIGGIETQDFLRVWRSARAGFEVMVHNKHGKVGETIDELRHRVLREQVSQIGNTPIKTAFDNAWKEGDKNELAAFGTGDKIHFHSLRAIYGNVSHLTFGKGWASLTVWVGRVLGHSVHDNQTALHYQTINLLDLPDIKKEHDEAELKRLLLDTRAIHEEMKGLLAELKDRVQTAVVPTTALWSDELNSVVQIGRLTMKKEGADKQAEEIVQSLKEAGINPTRRILKQLGFGTQRAAKFITRKKKSSEA